MELLKQKFDFDIAHVPYRNSPQSIADVAAGHVAASIAEAGASLPLIKDGKLRAIAVTSLTRFATLPEVPPIAEAVALPDLEAVSWHVLFARHDTPRPIVERLHLEMKRIMATPDMREKIANIGLIPLDPAPVEGMQQYVGLGDREVGCDRAAIGPGRLAITADPPAVLYRLVGLRVYKCPQSARLQGQAIRHGVPHETSEPRRPAPRLYLVTPRDPAGLADGLAGALAAADVAAVLLRLPAERRAHPGRPDPRRWRRSCTRRGAALLLDGHAELAGRTGADGAHLTGIDAFEAAPRRSSPSASPAAAGSPPATTPWWRPRQAPTTSCSASRIDRGAARVRGHPGARRLVGGGLRGSLRRLCRLARRGGAAGRRRGRFRRRRRLGLPRSTRPRRRRRRRSTPAHPGGDNGMTSGRRIWTASAALLLAADCSRRPPPRRRPRPHRRHQRKNRRQAGAAQAARGRPGGGRTPPPRPRRRDPDLAFGAFQRGHYMTAFASPPGGWRSRRTSRR